jgi:hypothetical protein
MHHEIDMKQLHVITNYLLQVGCHGNWHKESDTYFVLPSNNIPQYDSTRTWSHHQT